MERTDRSRPCVIGVAPVGLGERVRVQCQDGVERGSLVIIGGDAVEIRLHQRVAG